MTALEKLQMAALQAATLNAGANKKMSAAAKTVVVGAFVATLGAGHQAAYASSWDQGDKCAMAGAVAGGAVGYGVTDGGYKGTALGAILAAAGEAAGRMLCSDTAPEQDQKVVANANQQPVNRDVVGRVRAASQDWGRLADVDDANGVAMRAYLQYRDGLMRGQPRQSDVLQFNRAADDFWNKADVAYREAGQNRAEVQRYIETATALASIQDAIARGDVKTYRDLATIEGRERAEERSFAVELISANKRARQQRGF